MKSCAFPRWGRLVAAVFALVALWAFAGAQSRALLRGRTAWAVARGAATGDVPPAVAFANVALGGFRGTLADLLWLRAQRLQEAGRYIELVPLAESIAALEPDNGEIWAYHAWNLSFNICAMMRRPEDRWRWVRAGIDLLQTRGMRLNPHGARPRSELAWIFQFKLGTDTDPAAGYYRTEWARDLGAYLGPAGEPPEVPSLNASELMEVFDLDPERMAELDKQFGPLDWRVPGSHAVYWGMEGLDRATERERLACRRLVYQSLVQMIQGSGRIAGNPEDEAYNGRLVADTNLLPGTLRFLRETCAEHPSLGTRAALVGLLMTATRIESRANHAETARAHYDEIVAWFEPGSELPSLDDVIADRIDYGHLPWERLLDKPATP